MPTSLPPRRPPERAPVIHFVRACDCCRRNIALAEYRAGDGRCAACRASADAAALRFDALGLKFAAGAAGAGIVVLIGLAAWWMGAFGPLP